METTTINFDKDLADFLCLPYPDTVELLIKNTQFLEYYKSCLILRFPILIERTYNDEKIFEYTIQILEDSNPLINFLTLKDKATYNLSSITDVKPVPTLKILMDYIRYQWDAIIEIYDTVVHVLGHPIEKEDNNLCEILAKWIIDEHEYEQDKNISHG